MPCLIMKRSRVYIIPDGPPVATHYCPISKATYVVMRDDNDGDVDDKTFVPFINTLRNVKLEAMKK